MNIALQFYMNFLAGMKMPSIIVYITYSYPCTAYQLSSTSSDIKLISY